VNKTLSWLLCCTLVAACGSDPGSGDATEEPDSPGDAVEDGDGASETECTVDGDCDDGDPCTRDVCDTEFDECTHGSVDADDDGYYAAEVDGTTCDGTDCDDGDDGTHPSAAQGCEAGDDYNCNGLDDPDEDGDGFEHEECSGGTDCDDSDPDVFPGSTLGECSDTDYDCNGHSEHDNDGDGQDGLLCLGSDCDDEDDTVYFGASEIDCDGKDTDCNGTMSIIEDADGDGHPGETCVPAGVDPDCDDENRYVYPGATEVCDEVDDDCDGSWADGGADDDGDTFLDETCSGDDCDDTDPDTYLGSTHVDCSTTDHDCNTFGDSDNDGDGHDREDCGGDDCDDTDPTFHAGSTYVDCTTLDHDCNAHEDRDNDGDGHDREDCGGDDCDDSRPDAYPGAREICSDGVDQDCDTVADDSGTFMDDVRITTEPRSSIVPHLAWTGSTFGLTWMDARNVTYEVYFALLSDEGAKIGTDVRLTTATGTSGASSMVWTGSEFGVGLYDERDGNREIYFCRVSASGAKIGSEVRITTDVEYSFGPSIAWTGSEYGLAWQDAMHGNQEVYFVRLSGSGSPVGSRTRITDDGALSSDPRIAWTGSEFGLSWSDRRDGNDEIYFARVSAAGAQIGSDMRVTNDTAQSHSPGIAWSGSEIAVVWVDDRDGSYEIFFARLSPTGTKVGTDVQVTSTTGFIFNPLVVWSGSGWTLAWEEQRTGGREYFAARVSAVGVPIGTDVWITEDDGSNSSNPALAWTGSEFGGAWSDARDGVIEIYFNLFDFCP